MEIFDRTVAPAAVGAGIGVQPIGLTALKKLGLLEEVLAHGARIEAIRTWVKNDRATEGVWAGRRCLDIEYARYDPRLFGVGLARGVLFESLLGACQRQDGVTTRFGVSVEELEPGPGAGQARSVQTPGRRVRLAVPPRWRQCGRA